MASIFSRIIQGELPCEKIDETDNEICFLDISPFTEGHTLVIPKREVARFEELPETEAPTSPEGCWVTGAGATATHYKSSTRHFIPSILEQLM